jgi:pyridinium-3,5-bisthiocarboxylic acid mononucleotide nickel chelatase
LLNNGLTVTRLAWFNCFSGISADMVLASLIDAGADRDAIEDIVDRLPVQGWDLSLEQVQRAGLGATNALVFTTDDTTVVRTYTHIVGLIEEARFPDRVRDRAMKVFAVFAEAQSHLAKGNLLTFQETCDLRSIVTIIAACAALEVLNIDEIESSPLAIGTGVVALGSGLYEPTPSPLVMAVLAARKVPVTGRDLAEHLTTPTGAAFISALSMRFGPTPAMVTESIGYGAGMKSFDGMPNVLQVSIGDRSAVDRRGRRLTIIETNVEDATGEVLGYTVERLIEAGAIDAWIVAGTGKRGRPMHVVAALCNPAMAENLGAILMAETGSLGVRSSSVDRWQADRTFAEVDIEGYPVRIKVGPGRAKAEFDDAAAVAAKTGVPVREVIAKAETAYRRASEVRMLHPAQQQYDDR